MTRLVLNADDAGLAPAHARSVAALRASGAVTDVSLLTAGSGFLDAATTLRSLGVRSAGVHLCLSGGEAPVLPADRVASLAGGGRFPASWPSVVVAAAAGRIDLREVEAEWEAQVTRAAQAGFRLTHLDSHQHLHLLPRFLPVALSLARRFDIPFVRAPRRDDPAARTERSGHLGRLKERLLGELGRAARRSIRSAGLPEPPRLLGLAEAGRMTAGRLRELVERLPEEGDFEVALHPGTSDSGALDRYQWGYDWDGERRALQDPALAGLFSRAGIATLSFEALSAGRG